MDIKTFEAFSMKDAIKSVKRSLGQDAVILSTKEKPSADGKSKMIEVTAAAAHSSRSVGSGATSAFGGASLSAQLETQVEGLSIRMAALQDSMPTKRQVDALESGFKELKSLLVETLRGKDGSTMKDLPAPIVPIERQLRAMGVDDPSLADLMKHVRNLPTPDANSAADGNPEDYYRDHAIRWMLKRVKIAPRWTLTNGSPAVHAVVGPTGSGKSSLVAKLAAHYHLKEKVKVAVVSFDHARIAAAEQMRIFCKIVGVPFVAAADLNEMKSTLERMTEYDLILIDTAGVSAKNLTGLTAIESLKSTGAPIEFHLCLSITEKEAQLDQAVKGFAPLGLSSLMFAKLDESWSFGEIYNACRRWSTPLSFFSIGPEIPQDLERATRERVIERIFGL